MKWCHACSVSFDGDACPRCGQAAPAAADWQKHPPGSVRAGEGYDPAYFREVAKLETRHFWFRARARLILRALRLHFPVARSFLEIGCGTGIVLKAVYDAFPAMVVHGSELFAEGLSFAQARVPRAKLMQMDATRIPFADEFDVIGAFDVIEHIADDERVLAEIHRALKRGGGVIVTVPQHPWLWSHQDELAHHVRRYRRGELERKLREHGFRIQHSTSFVTALLPLLTVSRRAVTRNDDDPFHELRIGNTTNALLGAVSNLEFQLLRTGITLPIGGSRLVVAIKDSES